MMDRCRFTPMGHCGSWLEERAVGPTRIDALGRREESFDLMMFPGIGPATNGPRTVGRDSHDLNWTALAREWVHSHEGES
jgi:hypothetical protein